MQKPAETVFAFFAEWEKGIEPMLDAIRAHFTEDTIFENVNQVTTTGIDEAVALMQLLSDTLGMRRLTIETVNFAVSGDKVFTERVDTILGQDDQVISVHRLMGILETRDGKIVAWREYFDTATVPAAVMTPPGGQGAPGVWEHDAA